MHAWPEIPCGEPNGSMLQSSKDEHGPQTLLMQACPLGQGPDPPVDQQPVPFPPEQTPETQVSAGAQSESAEQVH
jgi:hypothetical protein